MIRLLVVLILLSGCTQVEDKEMENILKVGDIGGYQEISQKSNPDSLSLVYIPAVTALLQRAEQLKGRALSDEERLRIRAKANVTVMPKEVADGVLKQRGGVE